MSYEAWKTTLKKQKKKKIQLRVLFKPPKRVPRSILNSLPTQKKSRGVAESRDWSTPLPPFFPSQREEIRLFFAHKNWFTAGVASPRRGKMMTKSSLRAVQEHYLSLPMRDFLNLERNLQKKKFKFRRTIFRLRRSGICWILGGRGRAE